MSAMVKSKQQQASAHLVRFAEEGPNLLLPLRLLFLRRGCIGLLRLGDDFSDSDHCSFLSRWDNNNKTAPSDPPQIARMHGYLTPWLAASEMRRPSRNCGTYYYYYDVARSAKARVASVALPILRLMSGAGKKPVASAGKDPPPRKPRKAIDHYVLECFKNINKEELIDLGAVIYYCRIITMPFHPISAAFILCARLPATLALGVPH